MKAVFLTYPNEGSWARLDSQMSRQFVEALEELGIQVQRVDYEELRRTPEVGLRQIERAAPDFITSLTFNSLLLCGSGVERLLRLEIPTVALWDDPLGALANYMTYPSRWGLNPAAHHKRPRLSERAAATWSDFRAWLGGVRKPAPLTAPAEFLELTRNPYLIHVSSDHGHMKVVAELGLASPRQIHWHPIRAFNPCIRAGEQARHTTPTTDVAFCGNLYVHGIRQNAYWQDPFFRGLSERLAAGKARNLAATAWDLLLAELDALPATVRLRHGLFTHRPEFWLYYLFAVWSVLTTLPRLEVMRAIRQEVTLFGLFADPDSRNSLADYPNLKFARHLDTYEELPQQYAATKVNLCLTNGLIYQGTPAKLIDCLASGGFALCDPKEDLVRLFGSKAEAIFCRTPEEFADKVDYYLARPAERAEIVDALRREVIEKCGLRSLFTKVVEVVRSGRPEPVVGKDAA